MKQLRGPEPEKNNREKIGGSADQEVAETGDDCSDRANEILRRRIRRRDFAEPNPGRKILGVVGDERQEKQRTYSE